MEKKLFPEEFCKHTDGSFIGLQQDPIRGKCLALFVCKNCSTTYSMPLTYNEALLEFIALDMALQKEQKVA